MEGQELRDQRNVTLVTKKMEINLMSSAIDGRERIKTEFYKTYDVMTGIRIAATLGGFFSMMILLVLYKNYCKPSRTLSEEQLNAAVTAAVEEEDRALKAALEATSFYTSLSKQRQSEPDDNSAIISPRFSSVGGGCSHLTPPIRFSYLQQRGKSLPGSALRFSEEAEAKSPKDAEADEEGEDEEGEEDLDADCQLPDYLTTINYLSVPPDRRLSSITCSSADTSYLERRGSAFEMGRPAPPCFVKNPADNKTLGEEGPWDFYYPIDIQVIQPTPEISPAASAETLCEKPNNTCGLKVPGFHETHRLSVDCSEIIAAPLASISSLASLSTPSATIQPSTNSNQKQENVLNSNGDSVGSDSVFMDEEIHTEDEVEEFSTDSEFEYGGFDDDYSFCESNKRQMTRCKNTNLRFASFDSYEASTGQDTSSEDKENNKVTDDKPNLGGEESSSEWRKKFETGEGVKRKLSKTHSEPKSQKVIKQLPPWIDRGRSGFVPKRQLSVPASRGKSKGRISLPKEEAQPVSDSNKMNSPVSSPPQQKEPRSSTKQEEKRKRFQKQKTVNEEWNRAETSSEVGVSGECNLNSNKEEEKRCGNLEGGEKSTDEERISPGESNENNEIC